MLVLSSTRVGRGYRTTIPREVRKLLELGLNDTLEWTSRTVGCTLGRRVV